MNNDMKTNVAGFIGLVASILAAFHVIVPASVTTEQTAGIIAGIISMVIGYAATKKAE